MEKKAEERKYRVLVADDDEIVRFMLSEKLEENGFSPLIACNGSETVESFLKEEPDAVLLDLKMPGMDGIETMRELKKINPDVPIIIITAHGDIPTAVQAIKLGAYDFIEKPPRVSKLMITLRRAIEKLEMQRDLKRLGDAVDTSLEWLMGRSRVMRRVLDQVKQVAWSDFSVVLQGETGTGKSFLANAIHNLSRRAKNEFVKVDIGAIPETLVESELFGHERGAFTGAEKKKKGYFELANKGTIFIDEIENIPMNLQSKLLGVVEEKQIYPLGAGRPVEIDVRFITATNRDMKKSIKEKKFREDLFFRLGEFVINLPPLKERIEDIPFFFRKFLIEAATEMNRQIKEFEDAALDSLMHYHWPGNVRELRNVVRRAVLLSDDGVIGKRHIEFLIKECGEQTVSTRLFPLRDAVREVEREAVRQALVMNKGNKTRAAALLGIDYKTLLSKMKDYDLH